MGNAAWRGNGAAPALLLAEDAELARAMDRRRAQEAAPRLIVRAFEVSRGPWRPTEGDAADSRAGAFAALLVLDGLLLRETEVSGHPSADLLGPGDLVRTWDDLEQEILLPRRARWVVLAPARLAVIDQAFIARAAAWPEVLTALLERAARRPERLMVLQAIGHLTRVDDRLLALMWCLAERWGRVTPDGLVVDLRLPHRTLAAMVGARRPSVTTALGLLQERERLLRRADGAWLLRGDPPGDRPPGGQAAIAAY